MRIGRTIPPASVSIKSIDLLMGVRGVLSGESEVERFRSELKEHFGVRYCFLVSSGKAALALILLALKRLLPDRDEVLIPAFDCYSVPSSIVRAGLKPRLCDQDPHGLDFDFDKLSFILGSAQSSHADSNRKQHLKSTEQARCSRDDDHAGANRKLLCVVPTHLFGIPADVERLRSLIQDTSVTVVEDAAQAMGEVSAGRKLGTLGDVGFFSLGRGKAFSVVEGGIILTDRDDIANALRDLLKDVPQYGVIRLLKTILKAIALKVFVHPWLFWFPKSLPFLRLGETLFEPDFPILKMSAFQAGMARNWKTTLKRLRQIRSARVSDWISSIGSDNVLESSFVSDNCRALARFPLRVRDENKRKTMLRDSARTGKGVMPAYPAPIFAITELRGVLAAEDMPAADGLAKQLVTLPTHEYLSTADVKDIGELVSQALG